MEIHFSTSGKFVTQELREAFSGAGVLLICCAFLSQLFMIIFIWLFLIPGTEWGIGKTRDTKS